MRHLSFNNLSLILAAAAAVGACSPLAPSVSKLSNAAAHPTDSSSPSGALSNLSTLSKNSSSKHDDLPTQTTEVTHQSEFEQKIAKNGNNSRVLRLEDKRALSEFVTKGSAQFGSSNDIEGEEAKLARKPTKIYLVLNASLEALGRPEIGELKASLSWHPAANPDEEGHWELKCDRLSANAQDPVADLVTAEVRENLRQHLVKLGVEFQLE